MLLVEDAKVCTLTTIIVGRKDLENPAYYKPTVRVSLHFEVQGKSQGSLTKAHI